MVDTSSEADAKARGCLRRPRLVAQRTEHRLRQQTRWQLREIYVVNANGKGQRNLTRNPAYDADPAGRPTDGSSPSPANRDANYGVYLLNANGNGQRKLAQPTP